MHGRRLMLVPRNTLGCLPLMPGHVGLLRTALWPLLGVITSTSAVTSTRSKTGHRNEHNALRSFQTRQWDDLRLRGFSLHCITLLMMCTQPIGLQALALAWRAWKRMQPVVQVPDTYMPFQGHEQHSTAEGTYCMIPASLAGPPLPLLHGQCRQRVNLLSGMVQLRDFRPLYCNTPPP
jgi:hypothetical protein